MPADLPRMSADIRRTVIKHSHRAGVGHIGSCLSIADVLAALYGATLRGAGPGDPDRDRFILSKGHAALALYGALRCAGRLSDDELASYCVDGTALSGHPEHALGPVEFSTGSLGHGLAIGAGVALGIRLRRSAARVFVLLSDAECNEGSIWEAVMFAAHHRLANLVAVVDANGQQALGATRDVLDLEPLSERWRSFRWHVREVDGHDPEALARELAESAPGTGAGDGRPRVLIARTTFGKGVSYMEGQLRWHYAPMSDDDYERARHDLEDPVLDGR